MKKTIIILFVFFSISAFAQSDSLIFYMKAGNTKYMAKDYYGAYKDFSEAIRLNPRNAEAYKMRGIMNYLLYIYSDARDDMDKSLQLNLNCTDCVFYLSRIYAYYGDTSESRKYRNELKEKIICSSAMVYVESGNDKLIKLKDAKEAEKDYDKAISIYPNVAEAYYQKGYIRMQEGKNNEAIVLFDKALKIDSTFYLAYAMKGSAYFSLNNYQEAVVNYTKCIKYSPSYSYAYTCRANAYHYLSRNDKALADWKKARELETSIINN